MNSINEIRAIIKSKDADAILDLFDLFGVDTQYMIEEMKDLDYEDHEEANALADEIHAIHQRCCK